MKSQVSKSSLSPARQRFVEHCQAINFGRILSLRIVDGDPVFDSRTRIVEHIKLSGENNARPELESGDFLLKSQFVELFRRFDSIRDGSIAVIDVKHGLPFSLELESAAT